jgi:hypothetical protein
MTRKIKQPHYLHLIQGKGFMLMTLADAHQYALENNTDVWNVHESIDLEPEYFDSEAEVKEYQLRNSKKYDKLPQLQNTDSDDKN